MNYRRYAHAPSESAVDLMTSMVERPNSDQQAAPYYVDGFIQAKVGPWSGNDWVAARGRCNGKVLIEIRKPTPADGIAQADQQTSGVGTDHPIVQPGH